jgi:ankyrin repeat protein
MSDALFQAALNGDQDTLEAAKRDNAALNWDDLRDENGNTIAIAAASKGKLHIVEYVHANGACLDVANAAGKVAVQIAYDDGHPNTTRGIIRLYKAANKDVPLSAEALAEMAE